MAFVSMGAGAGPFHRHSGRRVRKTDHGTGWHRLQGCDRRRA